MQKPECAIVREIRVLDSDGNVERTIAFNQAARML
jgi:hypothetical protein